MPGGHSPAQPRTVTMTVAQALELGFQHYRARQLDQADAILRGILAANADQPDALHLSGLVAFQAGRHEEGVARVRRALAVYPTLTDANYNLASMLRQGGQLAEAREWLERGLVLEGLAVRNAAGRLDLFSLAKSVCDSPLARWSARLGQIGEYGGLLERAEDAKQGRRDLATFLGEQDLLRRSAPNEAFTRIMALLGLLGFSKASQPGWTRALFDELALPWMKEALSLGYYDLALKLETTIYSEFVKQRETEAHFRDCFGHWVDSMREAGAKAAQTLPAVAWPAVSGKPVIGFFVHQASLLAHIEVLLNMLEGLPQGDDRPFYPRVYIFAGTHPGLLDRLARCGVPAVILEQDSQEGGDGFRRLLYLRNRLARDQVTALVWVSLAVMMPFAFALRLAPVQIWWAMKYHGLEFDEIDGYVTGGGISEYKQINAKIWRNGRNSFTNLYDAGLFPEAQQIKARYSNFDVVLGTFGREEKLNSEEFLESVVAALRSSPGAAFLWTGRTQLAAIQRRFEDGGVAKQCFFVGWVNTKLYAQVVDIFLDSFPFPCGLTVMEAMAAGKPALLYASHEAYETGLHGMITPMLKKEVGTVEEQDQVQNTFQPSDHESLYFCAANPQEYVSFALRLVQDPALRQRSGLAYKTFVEIFLQDTRKTGMSYSKHFLEVIEECRKRSDIRTDASH